MNVRVAVPGDEASVSRLLLASYAGLLPEDCDAATLAAALPRMVRANPGLLGAGTFYVVDGPACSIVGCGGWTLAAPDANAHVAGLAHLRHFATHPDFVRRGLGRLVYDRCVRAMRSAGVVTVQAYASLTAVPFYSAVGLELTCRFDLSLGADVVLPAALMTGKI